MHAVIRRYEGVDTSRMDELTERVRDDLLPRIMEIPGFDAYFLVDAGAGVIASLGIFETQKAAEESTRIGASFVKEAGIEAAVPRPPQVTTGELIAHSARAAALA
jgi:hypothetical protein